MIPFHVGTVSILAEFPWSQPELQEILEVAAMYLPMAGLFLVGIWIGYLFFGRRRPKPGPSPKAPETGVEQSPPAEMPSENFESEPEMARLEGELSSVRMLVDQQREEMTSLQERLALMHQHLEEKQHRVAELSESLESAVAQQGSRAVLAQCRGPLIHLGEVVRMERQRIGGGVSRLHHLEERLSAEEQLLWRAVEEIALVGSELEQRSDRKDASAKKLINRISRADEQVRVLHQNIRGCIQRITTARTRLQKEQSKLREAAQPIVEAETQLAALAAAEESPKPDTLKDSLANVLDQLAEAQPLVESLQNAIDQEIAEMTGRVDWAVRDSPKSLLKTIDRLNEGESGGDLGTTMLVGKIWRRLSEIKGSLDGVQLTLESGAVGESTDICGKRTVLDSLKHARTVLESARDLPISNMDNSTTSDSEQDGTVAHLERQLDLRETETQRLHGELAKREDEIGKLQESLTKARNASRKKAKKKKKPDKVQKRTFVRRLLGLDPGKPVDPGETDPDESVEDANLVPATTLKEARQVLNELKLSQPSGNGDRSESAPVASISSEPGGLVDQLKEKIADQSSRIRDLEQKLSEAIPSPRPVIQPAEEEMTSSDSEKKPAPRLAGVMPGHAVEPDSMELVVYRGSDPRTWNSDYKGGNDEFAVKLGDLPAEIRYLRMRRLDTGDSVVIPISQRELLSGISSGKGWGWFGKQEQFFGGTHFGIFDESVPREVETRFGIGGWGFGHQAGVQSEQAFGWAGKRIDPTAFEISIGTGPADAAESESPVAEEKEEASPQIEIPEEGLILFRGNDPGIWDQEIYRGTNCRARTIRDLPDTIEWLRIRRLPEGESVIVPVSKAGLTENGEGRSRAFNGTNEVFYGAHHLGAYDETLPQDVETRFTYGGWGFGHCPLGEENQACGWAGREVSAETVFEFSVFTQRPTVDERRDQVLD